MNHRDYFKDGEYILVDKGEFMYNFMIKIINWSFSGYISSPYTIQPFDETEIKSVDKPTQKQMRAFNKCLSGVWIGVEHAFGMLKGRFQLLKEMGPHVDIQEMYKAIEVLLILHNMCIGYGDKPEDI